MGARGRSGSTGATPGPEGPLLAAQAEGLGHRRHVVAVSALAGAGLLGASLSTEPGSPRFYGMTLGVAGVYTAGGLASGPLRLGRGPAGGRPVAGAVGAGVGSFAVFYGCALVARRIPFLNRAITRILGYAHHGSTTLVLGTALANAVAEEVYFRGALYAAFGGRRPVTWSTAAWALATTATRNPALVLASVLMGPLFALQRRATGGVLAPAITHVVWSTLMLWMLPPLFPPNPDEPVIPDEPVGLTGVPGREPGHNDTV